MHPVASAQRSLILIFIICSSAMTPTGFLLLLLVFPQSTSASLPPPRISFLLDATVRPLISFSLPEVQNTTTLLLSKDGATLYVGAQDAILSLDVSKSDAISLKKKVSWHPTKKELEICGLKTLNPTVNCPNFVHVLQELNSTHLYACGSYAYSPHDGYIETENFTLVHHDGAKGRCPFNPFQRSSAIAVDGELFTASTTDFRGVQPQISRHFTKDGHPDINLESSVSLLEEPSFISSSLDSSDRKLYFFFSEVGKEFSYIKKLRVSRVAQVCKDDVGGQRTLQKKWTSFAKAPLLCQPPRQLPFDILQDVFTMEPPEGNDASETLFYGIFTHQWSTFPGSAVCVFKLQDIRTVFSGRYKTFTNQQFTLLPQKYSFLGKCGLQNHSDPDLEMVKKSFITSASVSPVGDGPIIVFPEQRYSRVVAMTTKAASGKEYTILYLLTDSGFLHKVVLLDQGPRVVEEIQVSRPPQEAKSLVVSSDKMVVYVATSLGVTGVPVADCSVYRSCSQCVLAQDPLCGWSRTTRVCTRLDHSQDGDVVQMLDNTNVAEKCEGQSNTVVIVEINARSNEAVRLNCLKPSNMATLIWMSSSLQALPERLFIRSDDGSSLSFFAGDETLGKYHCEAEESGYRETIASYHVKPVPSPRAVSPPEAKTVDKPVTIVTEQFEDIAPEEPTVFATEDKNDPEESKTTEPMETKADTTTTTTTEEQDLTAVKDTQSANHDSTPKEAKKSYYGEMVTVSLLLVVCISILAVVSLHVWRLKKTQNVKPDRLVGPKKDGSCGGNGGTDKSLETCSLSSPEDSALDIKVVG
ncbi:semaphorin-4A [Pholidichthys leucotaenia]